jgi:predicted  nucleic acid-binding Zn-ribbon protein
MASRNENTGRIILVITGILVLTALAYFATRYFTTKEQLVQSDVQIKELITEIEEKEGEIVNLQTQIDDQATDLQEKDRLLDEQLAQIGQLERKLSSFRGSPTLREKVKNLESRISLMRTQVNNYQETITRLEQRVQQQSDTIAQVLEENDQQAATINELEETTAQQQTRLERAAVLQAADFDFFRVKKSGKEVEDKDFRRLFLREMKVCFDILKNNEAQAGPRELFLVIEQPDGTALTNEAAGLSGQFRHNGVDRSYSARAQITYSLTTQQVCIPFSIADGEKFEKGEHYVSVYTEGELIGQGSFEVK